MQADHARKEAPHIESHEMGAHSFLPASRMMDIVLCCIAILKGSPSYPTAAAWCILFAIPFAIAVCDLMHYILQADTLIEGALA